MTTRTFTAAEMEKRADHFTLCSTDWRNRGFHETAQHSQVTAAMLRQAAAASEREAALRDELEQLRQWKQNVGIQAALDRAYNEGGAAERQKVQALREWLDRNEHVPSMSSDQLLTLLMVKAKCDTLGLTTEPTP